MTRPRWHDAVITSVIVGLLAAGVWALWWDELRSRLRLAPDGPAPIAQGQT